MNIKEITGRVTYVGVNDRHTAKFENLWPLPMGVSYNSYIVSGSEKVALIDTAPVEEMETYFSNLRRILAGRKVDYLVINHMEPDHSGLMAMVRREWPELKFVVNRVTLPMARGFSGINDEEAYHIVADGETLSLGDATLRFVTVPMVHWPETMVTYLEEDRVLFTCDALGCFGALPGGVVDTEFDTEPFFPEMERYYAAIVAKFAPFVQKALKKISGLEIAYACPSHGPVWHQQLAKVVDIYDRLSDWRGEDGVVMAYASMYGNTGRLADMIAKALIAKGVRKLIIHDLTNADMSCVIRDIVKYKGVILGSPTYNMDLFPTVKSLANDIAGRDMKNKVFGAFGTYAWNAMALKKLEEFAGSMNWPLAAGISMGQAGNADTPKAVVAFADEFMKAYAD